MTRGALPADAGRFDGGPAFGGLVRAPRAERVLAASEGTLFTHDAQPPADTFEDAHVRGGLPLTLAWPPAILSGGAAAVVVTRPGNVRGCFMLEMWRLAASTFSSNSAAVFAGRGKLV